MNHLKKNKRNGICYKSAPKLRSVQKKYDTLVYSIAIKIAINQIFKMRELSHRQNIL